MHTLKLFRRCCILHGPCVIPTVDEAVSDIPDGATLMVGGFGLCGAPQALIEGVHRTGSKNLTVISDNAGVDDLGLGLLLKSGRIKRLVASYVGGNKTFAAQYLAGKLELDLRPQGSFIAAIRSGGAGIPAFFTPTGYGTQVHTGGIPIKMNPDGTPQIVSEPKEVRQFNGRNFLLERSLFADYSLVRAYRADKWGNLQYKHTARNFNPAMATAAPITIAEVEEVVDRLDPDQIHTPSVFVQRIVRHNPHPKPVQVMKTRTKGQTVKSEGHPSTWPVKERIARRAALELVDGMYVNLGIGIPTLATEYLRKDSDVVFQAENGLLGMGPHPEAHMVDADLINPGKEPVTFQHGSATFGSDLSFDMIRGGHMNLTMLGAMEVSREGDLANWVIPGKLVKGMGGAMDLVGCSTTTKVVAVMAHTSKDGASKILNECDLPITGKGVVDHVITELCVFSIRNRQLVLTEIMEGLTLDDIRAATAADFVVADDLKTIAYA